jgi:hypothetical protein
LTGSHSAALWEPKIGQRSEASSGSGRGRAGASREPLAHLGIVALLHCPRDRLPARSISGSKSRGQRTAGRLARQQERCVGMLACGSRSLGTRLHSPGNSPIIGVEAIRTLVG